MGEAGHFIKGGEGCLISEGYFVSLVSMIGSIIPQIVIQMIKAVGGGSVANKPNQTPTSKQSLPLGGKGKPTYWWSKQELVKNRPGDAAIWAPVYKTVYYQVPKREFDRLMKEKYA